MKVRALPARVEALLQHHPVAPRLKAHLMLVHEVASILTQCIHATWPMVSYEVEAVLLGAATHDIGKVVHPEELSAPGHAHEQAGYQLLLANGWPERLARFTRTHASTRTPPGQAEDLMVALADSLWKGKREDSLEQALANLIALQSGEEPWRVWLSLDDILSDIASTSDERLAWQANYHV